MRLPNPLCWLRSAWYSLIHPGTLIRSGIPAKGHHYVLSEEHDGCHVEILRCEECGHVEIGWAKRRKEAA